MNAEQINAMNHEQIRIWLAKALSGQTTLSRLTPDESHYLGILRMDKSVDPAARKSLRDGTLYLLRQFCDLGAGETPYIQELLALATAFNLPETPGILAGFARRFPELPDLPLKLRFAVLGALVDATTPLETSFWKEILAQDPERNALLALAGIVATNLPYDAIKMLPQMPDSLRAGQAAVINLEIAWDSLSTKERSRFVTEIQKTLLNCGENFANPLRAWIEKKVSSRSADANPSLSAALHGELGDKIQPKTRISNLCPAV